MGRIAVCGNGFEQRDGFLQRQVLGKCLFLFGGINIGGRVDGKVAALVDQILEQCLDGGQLACLGRGTVFAHRVGVDQEGVYLIRRDRAQVFQIHRQDTDGGKALGVIQHLGVLPAKQVPEKCAQVEQVLLHRALRTALNG